MSIEQPSKQNNLEELLEDYPNIEIPTKENIATYEADAQEVFDKIAKAISGAVAQIGEDKLKEMNIKFTTMGYGARIMNGCLLVGCSVDVEKIVKQIVDNKDNEEIQL